MMQLAHTIEEIRLQVHAARSRGLRIGFVPTMGALHTGHLSLVERCKKDGALCVVSIFVNPTQFGPQEDFSKYPRTLDSDLKICSESGVDLVFAPDNKEMYPPGDQTRVRPGPLADTLCGPFRPCHFEGVCTVVAKLFNIVSPDAAYFGQKDAQQLAIIRRMVRDLAFPIEIVGCPLVRDADGLALSSRNQRLLREDRANATALYQALITGRDLLLSGETSVGRIIARMRMVLLSAGITRVDYLSIVDPDELTDSVMPCRRAMIAGAVWMKDVRLIDNIVVDLAPAAS